MPWATAYGARPYKADSRPGNLGRQHATRAHPDSLGRAGARGRKARAATEAEERNSAECADGSYGRRKETSGLTSGCRAVERRDIRYACQCGVP